MNDFETVALARQKVYLENGSYAVSDVFVGEGFAKFTTTDSSGVVRSHIFDTSGAKIVLADSPNEEPVSKNKKKGKKNV